MKKTPRLLVVSNRLPMTLSRNEGKWCIQPSSGGLVSALGPVLRNRGGFWAGWPGTTEKMSIRTMSELLGPASESSGYRLLPVVLSSEEVDNFYSGFSNSVLWPLFHDFQSRCDFSPRYWDGYLAVNRKFSRVLNSVCEDGDFVWVNDFHLIPLGEMLRSAGKSFRTSFFLHIPFPPADIFMKMPWRYEILGQMSQYDFVCFQTLRDRRNFMDCLRIFFPDFASSGRGHVLRVRLNGRHFFVGSLPISIDYQSYSRKGSSRAAISRAKQIKEGLFAEKLILGVDRLDYSKGIPEKLRGFQRCLEMYPQLVEKATLYQVVVPSRESVGEYKALKEEIELLISRINGKYSSTKWIPVNWYYGSVSGEELAALYRAADMALITSLKDGMNLVSKEYCACKGRDPGVLILSEFAGAALQLSRGAILVNPYDIDRLAAAIFRGFSMEDEEKKKKMNILRRSIARQDVFWWVDNFLRAGMGKRLEDFPEADIPTLWPGLDSERENGI